MQKIKKFSTQLLKTLTFDTKWTRFKIHPSNLNIPVFLIQKLDWVTGKAYINPFPKLPFSIFYMSFRDINNMLCYLCLWCHSIHVLFCWQMDTNYRNKNFQIPRFKNFYDCFSLERPSWRYKNKLHFFCNHKTNFKSGLFW